MRIYYLFKRYLCFVIIKQTKNCFKTLNYIIILFIILET